MPKTVAIVGAGPSGLASLKCCLDEGLKPTCFERSDDIGGIWQYTENVEEGRPSIYKSLVSNASKEMSAFSDFPYPEDFPVFLPNARLLEYLAMYTKHFDLRRHIQFKVSFIKIDSRKSYFNFLNITVPVLLHFRERGNSMNTTENGLPTQMIMHISSWERC
uniref:Flavin-containing monooxygenase n=1 Tax=Anolis carolinensis TaxID=28377 RepID=A0A803TCS8_ANOCA